MYDALSSTFCHWGDTYFGMSEENLKEEYFQMQSIYRRNEAAMTTVDGMPVYPGFTALFNLASAISLSAAICEREFQTQNRIKSQKKAGSQRTMTT